MKKIFPIFISVSVLIIAFSVAYYFVIFLPQKEQARLDQQKRNEQLLDTCLEEADREYQEYSDFILEYANSRGRSITQKEIDKMEKYGDNKLKSDRDKCFKRYPQK